MNDAPMQLYLLRALHRWQIRSGDLNHEVLKHARIARAASLHVSNLNQASVWNFRRIGAIMAHNLWVLGYPRKRRQWLKWLFRMQSNRIFPTLFATYTCPR